MANFTTITAETRELAGKGAARATRRAGKVPAVIYGAKQTPELISLDPRDINRELVRGGWRSRLFELSVGDSKQRALMRAVQFHPESDKPEHVDFQRLAAGEQIRVAVKVNFINDTTSPGLKRGGMLNVVRHTVEVLVDPDHVPEAFEADLGALDINDNIRFSDLMGTADVKPTISDRDFVVATVAAPTKAAEVPAAEGGAAPAAAPHGGPNAPSHPPAQK